MDSGAEKCVMGWSKATRYTTCADLPLKLRPSRVLFRFTKHHAASAGIMEIRLPVPEHRFLLLGCHVVHEDVPLLIGLEVLRAFCLRNDFRIKLV